jgi:hypothetical protein
MKHVSVFFRNDDADTFEFGDKRRQLRKLTNLFYELGIPLIQAVVPYTVTEETIKYLSDLKKSRPDLIEIVQHGYKHCKYVEGEFDKTRSFDAQYSDVMSGKQLMETYFREYFYPGFVFPFNEYVSYSLSILDRLNFKVFSSYWKTGLAHRIGYKICRIFRIEYSDFFHLSRHLQEFGNSRILECSTCLSLVERNSGNLLTVEECSSVLRNTANLTPVVGIVLHYNTLCSETEEKNIDRLKTFLECCKEQEDIEFVTFSSIWNRIHNSTEIVAESH